MQLLERPLAQIPLKKKDGYILLSLPNLASAPDEFRLTPYRTLQISTIKGTPEADSTWVPMATSTVERVREQTELEKEDKVVTGK